MKIKTNLRAGSGSNSTSVDTSSTTVDTSGQTQNQKGKTTTTATTVYYSRCAGL